MTRDEFSDNRILFAEGEADSSLKVRSPSERSDFIAIDVIRARNGFQVSLIGISVIVQSLTEV